MSKRVIYRATVERMGGQVTSSYDMTQDYVEREMCGALHLAFWAQADDDIRLDATAHLVSVERTHW
jgi:hypothetical protein